jgi:hypothetical protein
MRTTLDSLLSQTTIAEVRQWLRGLFASRGGGVAVLTAPTGSGLSTMVRLLLSEIGADVVDVGSSQLRLKAFVADACQSPISVTGRPKVLVVEEFDVLVGTDANVAGDLMLKAPRVATLCLARSGRSSRFADATKAYTSFAFRAPRSDSIARVLLAARRGDAAAAARVAAECRGDVRAALAAWAFKSAKAPAADAPAADDGSDAPNADAPAAADAYLRDMVPEGMDSVEALLASHSSVDAVLAAFSSDPGIVSMGLWENYTSVAADVCPGVSESFSAADVVDAAMYRTQNWTLHDVYGAFAAAAPSAYLTRTPKAKKPRIDKFGTIWSRMYNQCARLRHVKGIARARAEAGLGFLQVEDLAYLRDILDAALASGDADAVRAAAAGVGGRAEEVLMLMRLWERGYRQSAHSRVKKMLL